MARVPFSRWHRKARIVMGSATFFDAFDALSLAFVLPVLSSQWQLGLGQIGTLIAAGYVGQFLGALFFGNLAERIGRVRSASVAIAVMSIMALACALTGNYAALLVCRFVQGIGVGGEVPVAATYINELSPAQNRGRFFLLYELIFPIGLMATGQLGAWLVPAFGWQSMFLVGAAPGIFIAVLVWFLPESPRWLIHQGRHTEAEKIVREIEASTDRRVPSPAALTTPAVSPKTSQPGGWRELISGNYRNRTLIVWVLWFSTYLVANGLNNWLPTLYTTVYNLDLKSALRCASLTNVVQVVVTLACALLVDRVGRKRWATACYLGAGGLFLTVWWRAADSVFAVGLLATLGYGLLGSVNVLLYLYTPEIYPTRIRAVGTGLATAWLRLGSSAGPAIVGSLMLVGGVPSVFLMFAAVCGLGLAASFGMIETRNRRLEEITP